MPNMKNIERCAHEGPWLVHIQFAADVIYPWFKKVLLPDLRPL